MIIFILKAVHSIFNHGICIQISTLRDLPVSLNATLWSSKSSCSQDFDQNTTSYVLSGSLDVSITTLIRGHNIVHGDFNGTGQRVTPTEMSVMCAGPSADSLAVSGQRAGRSEAFAVLAEELAEELAEVRRQFRTVRGNLHVAAPHVPQLMHFMQVLEFSSGILYNQYDGRLLAFARRTRHSR